MKYEKVEKEFGGHKFVLHGFDTKKHAESALYEDLGIPEERVNELASELGMKVLTEAEMKGMMDAGRVVEVIIETCRNEQELILGLTTGFASFKSIMGGMI